MGPASTFQVALVPPYGEVDNAVKPIPKTRWRSKEICHRGYIEDIREHGRKKNHSMNKLNYSSKIILIQLNFELILVRINIVQKVGPPARLHY